jgi:membrane-bound lytic murein transglycosylase B
MSWTLLAGIGLVESRHGSAGGATLQADGVTSTPILGPALDGSRGTVAIPATAEGLRLDGDPKWDHAIGPMQFIPSTWSRWGRSADGGTPNPNDIDDAALTAAAYLCAAGGDVGTAAGWQAAISAYNAPPGYAVEVTDQANVYAQQSLS